MSEVSTERPGRRLIPVAELSDAEMAAAVGHAAQAYDYENRPRDRSWTAVPLAQALRIVTGALGAMEFDPAPEPELTALREGIAALADRLETSAKATHPSRKTQIELECAAELRKLLEG